MARVLPFPEDRAQLQKWHLWVSRRGQRRDLNDIACAWAILLEPICGRRVQEILVLKESVVRATAGESDTQCASATRDRLQAQGAIQYADGNLIRFVKDVGFPSPSLAADVLSGRAQNGWKAWQLDVPPQMSLSEAYDLDELGEFELRYYEPPAKVTWVPRS